MRIAERFGALCHAGLSATVLAVAACSGAASADFAHGPSRDATAPEVEVSPSGMDATRPADEAAASDEDAGDVKDSGVRDEASIEGDSGGSIDAGDDGNAAVAVCARICMGCCDEQGQCHPGNTMAVCGAKGNLCEACAKHVCSTLTEAPCCGASGCGCAVAGILGCN